MSQPPVISFAAIHGHERACDFLRTAVGNGRLAHALLFAGADGIGKRSVALAFAAWVHCAEVDGTTASSDACGACASCRQIAAGSHPDVQLVSVASGKKEIGVDRIRELKRFMQLRPMLGMTKVAIIDEAPLLTVAAQNALLKTLEEPPDHSLLILVASNPDALLPTVRSRCQRLRFTPLPVELVARIVASAAGIDTAAARELAVLAEGSPGRALTLGRAVVGAGRARLIESLAGLNAARYVRLAHMAHELSHPEADVGVKLETLLAQYRDDALRAIGAPQLALHPARPLPAPQSAPTLLRHADAVYDAWSAIRRGNPNRQLLFEALLLRLART
jgi:DNA polymerase-3 subunit delta'